MSLFDWMRPLGAPAGLSAFLGTFAAIAVIATLGDPGITSDEPLDVQVGRRYLDRADLYAGLYSAAFTGQARRADADRLFRDNAQHPPLGRLILGLASMTAEPLEGLLGGSDPYSVHPARLAPALAFGLTVALLAGFSARRQGPAAGWATGLAMLFMPRLFSHAHFATLDTLLNLFWISALLAVEAATRRGRTVPALTLAGVIWGLALLTKIHAWLLLPFVLAFLPMRLGLRRGAIGAAAWAAAGLAVFLAGWPWLWFDSARRLGDFLGTSVVRMPLRAQYFGQVFLDRDVPWHYPWFYFLATVPVGLHLLGFLGARGAWRSRKLDPFPAALGLIVAAWLAVFSTGAPVYDGERLFLAAFPLWAVLVGRGFQHAWARRKLRLALVLLLATQAYGVLALHPFGLSYYNILVGGLPGAERLGLELTYWGDTVDTPLLDALARHARPGQSAAVVPTLHHIQAPSLTTSSLMERKIRLLDQAASGSSDWLVVYRRTAYWPPGLEQELSRCRPVRLQKRQGVWLSGLWQRPGVRFVEHGSPGRANSSSPRIEMAGRSNTILSE